MAYEEIMTKPTLSSAISKTTSSISVTETNATMVMVAKISGKTVKSGTTLQNAAVESVVSKDSKGNVKTTVLVPSEARNCVGYGLGISDSVCNIADFENGVYTQMCGIVDLGDLTYALAGSEFNSANFVSTYNAKIDRGGLCAIYTGGNTYNEYSALGNKAIHIDNNGRLYIKDNSYSTGDALKAALKGVKFVFELASAKTTPLSDFIRPLPVEQGGTLTLVNEHDLDMPSVIKYKKEVN